jgi:hypothetical protein
LKALPPPEVDSTGGTVADGESSPASH